MRLNGDGREVANMGIAAGDYENNGHMDLVNTTFSDDYDVIFRNDGDGELHRCQLSGSGSPGPRSLLSALATAFSTTTTTDGKIC